MGSQELKKLGHDSALASLYVARNRSKKKS